MAVVLDKIFIRFYRGQERDQEIADYLAQFNNAPRGTKPEKLKELAILGLRTLEKESDVPDLDTIRDAVRQELSDAGVSAQVDPDAIQRAVREAVEESTGGASVDLAAIRRIVDAALSQALNGLSLQTGSEGVEEKESAEDLLSKLDQSLGIRA